MIRWTGAGFTGQPPDETSGAIAFHMDEWLIELEIRVSDEPTDEVETPAPCPAR